jgi:hypothetical protein
MEGPEVGGLTSAIKSLTPIASAGATGQAEFAECTEKSKKLCDLCGLCERKSRSARFRALQLADVRANPLKSYLTG